jgi:hypothetical protein
MAATIAAKSLFRSRTFSTPTRDYTHNQPPDTSGPVLAIFVFKCAQQFVFNQRVFSRFSTWVSNF